MSYIPDPQYKNSIGAGAKQSHGSWNGVENPDVAICRGAQGQDRYMESENSEIQAAGKSVVVHMVDEVTGKYKTQSTYLISPFPLPHPTPRVFAHMWRSEDNPESSPSFHRLGAQVKGCGGKHLYPQGHLTSPKTQLFLVNCKQFSWAGVRNMRQEMEVGRYKETIVTKSFMPVKVLGGALQERPLPEEFRWYGVECAQK